MDDFYRIKRLPPYVFTIVNDLKTKARARGEDIIDLGMGNPDMPTPKHIVDKLVEAAQNPKNHRYSASKGITRLRKAMATWYRDRYEVELDHDAEVIATIGAKEGMAHLALAVLQPGDGVLVPNPTYPIHAYSVMIADGDLRSVPLSRTATSSRASKRRRSSRGRSRRCWSSRSRTTRPPCASTATSSSASSSSRASTGSWSSTTSHTPTSRTTAIGRRRSSRCPARRTSASRSSRRRSPTTCPAGGSASCAATRE